MFECGTAATTVQVNEEHYKVNKWRAKQLTKSDKAKYRPEHDKKPNHRAEGAIYTQLLLRRLVFESGFKGRGDALYFIHFRLATYTDSVQKHKKRKPSLSPCKPRVCISSLLLVSTKTPFRPCCGRLNFIVPIDTRVFAEQQTYIKLLLFMWT